MGLYGWTDCPESTRKQLYTLKDKLLEHLGGNVAGIYVHGSLALDSFNPETSDLDVIVLLRKSIDAELKFELVKVFLDLSNRPSPIEISLLAQDDIWPWKYPTPYQLHSSEYWRTAYEELIRTNKKHFWSDTREDPDLACHIALLREKGICLYGAALHEAFPPVPEQHLRSSILGDVGNAADALHTNPVYGVLTLCRILSYLETGRIMSKGQAGRWAIPLIPEKLRELVAGAIDINAGKGSNPVIFDEDAMERFKTVMLAAIRAHVEK